MKCPHCEYIDGWNAETLESVRGDVGEFFHLPIKLLQNRPFEHYSRQADLIGCPKCSKTFIDY